MKKEYLIYKLSEAMKDCTRIDNELFPKFDVKRGLRNEDGTGVLVGLTKIGNVVGYERIPGGGLKPIPGKLFYRGYDLEDLAHAILKEKRFGFEEVALTPGTKIPVNQDGNNMKVAEDGNYTITVDMSTNPNTITVVK
jgi:citrate synthase